MNANTDHFVIKTLAWAALIGFVTAIAMDAYAIDFPATSTDPLRTNPPILETGAVLPRDTTPISCPPPVDLTQPLALHDAVDLALCNNSQVKIAWAAIKIQASAAGEARAAYLPTLTSSISVLRNRTRYPGFPDSNTSTNGHTTYAALNWRLFDFGSRSANQDAANQLLISALASHDAVLQRTLAAVTGAYFDALTADAAREARSQATALAQETSAASQRREDKGAAGRNDTLQANTALAKAKLAEQRAWGDYRKALAVLGYALGVPTGTPTVLPKDNPIPPARATDDLALWLDVARQKHPAIIAAKTQWGAAKSKAASARADGLPTVDFVTNYYQNGYPNQGLQPTKSNTMTAGVTINIPLFDGFARTYKIREAQAQIEQSEAQMEDVEHQILSEVVKAHADALSSLANLESSEILLKSAEDAVASVQNRYSRGVANILEMLSVQSALADAQQERVRCLSEWRAARFRLMANAGLLGSDLIVDESTALHLSQ
ncbi:MAG: TolC family protein [Pseudomonadota bacterium]